MPKPPTVWHPLRSLISDTSLFCLIILGQLPICRSERAPLRRRFAMRTIELFLIQERLRVLWSCGHVRWIQGLNDSRGYHNQQLSVALIVYPTFEKIAEDW